MKAFHNDAAIKEKYLNRVRLHAATDEIVKGQYWVNGKGCAVGCTIHSGNHSAYEDELGIPEIIAKLEDRIFEELPNESAMRWPLRFLEAIPVGADLSKVWPQFAIFLLTNKTQCASSHPQCKIVADAWQRQLKGESIDWSKVTSAASADFCSAAAIYSAAPAIYAAYAASVTAYAAAYAASAAADAGKAKQYAYIAQSEKLLELLREAAE